MHEAMNCHSEIVDPSWASVLIIMYEGTLIFQIQWKKKTAVALVVIYIIYIKALVIYIISF